MVFVGLYSYSKHANLLFHNATCLQTLLICEAQYGTKICGNLLNENILWKKLLLFPCSNVSIKLFLNMQKRKKTLKVATEYPKESIKYEKQKYYFVNEKQIWMFLLQTSFFCKCFLSKLYYVFWFTHSTILEAATYIKWQLTNHRMAPPYGNKTVSHSSLSLSSDSRGLTSAACHCSLDLPLRLWSTKALHTVPGCKLLPVLLSEGSVSAGPVVEPKIHHF